MYLLVNPNKVLKFATDSNKDMKTIDQINKIKATVLYILQHFREGVDYIHLFKIMYFAQQSHLVKYGRPIVDDSFVARKHGPVPALTYKVLQCAEGKDRDNKEDLNDFINSIRIIMKDGHQVVELADGVVPDMDEFSKSDISLLDSTIEKYKDVESYKLSDLSHLDKAYDTAKKESEKTGEDIRIPLVNIAKAGGATKAMQEVIRNRQINKRELEWV